MSALDEILQRNRGARPLPLSPQLKLCVITCDDAALTGQLEAGLGLKPGETVMIRLPGGGGGLSEELVQRAVAKAVYVDGCGEVLLLTHSLCTLHQLSANALIDSMRAWNVQRSAIPYDLREMVGAGNEPRETVRRSAEGLRRCAFLPESLTVHVGHFDEQTGELAIIENGDSIRPRRAPDTATAIAGYASGPAQGSSLHIDPVSIPVVTTPDLVGTESIKSERPPMAKARPPPPPGSSRHPKQNLPAMRPELVEACEKVRTFITAQIRKDVRKAVKEQLASAFGSGQPSEELVKIAVAPILKSGDERYAILDDVVVLKEELSALPPDQAIRVLRAILGQ